MERQYQRDRAAAFGAIRRAAEVARRNEMIAAEYYKAGENESGGCMIMCAVYVRRAIRAAIGSEKT